MKELLLNRKYLALVDDEDYERCQKYVWWVSNEAQIHGKVKGKIISLSNFIMKDLKPMYDHKDRNFLNNQKDNLRPATQSQNGANKDKYAKNSSSIYKGVSFCKRDDCWRAHIKKDGKCKALGTFITEEAAAMAYNAAAKAAFGKFAVLNIIEK